MVPLTVLGGSRWGETGTVEGEQATWASSLNRAAMHFDMMLSRGLKNVACRFEIL